MSVTECSALSLQSQYGFLRSAYSLAQSDYEHGASGPWDCTSEYVF